MGYEQRVPPLPTRQEEQKMIKNLEESWLKQPYYKYYMNEALRETKMDLATKINKSRSDYLLNFIFYGALTLPFFMLTKRFFLKSSSGVPTHHQPYYFLTERSSSYIRNKSFGLFVVPAWLLTTMYLAEHNVDSSDMQDEYLVQGKIKKML